MTFTLLGQNKPTAVFSHVFEYGYLQLLQFQGGNFGILYLPLD